ncbi:MAG: GGDEF domain-containing protein [Burkholderiales bacterium]
MISQLDRGTLDVVTMLVAIVPCCVAISIWRINRALEGPLFWMLAITLTLLTYAAVPLLQVLGAPPGVAVAMNNTSSLTSMLLLLEGNLRFTGRVSSARLKWGVLAVLLFLTLSILNRDDAARRYLFHDPIAAGLLLANAATLLLRPPASERGVRTVAAVFPLLMAMVFMARWWVAFEAEPGADLSRHAIVMPLMIAGILFTLGWTYFASLFCYTRSQAQLARQAREDALTGLANRRYFDEAVQREIARCRRSGAGFALVTLDLDNFKQVNDRFGHAAGDQLLAEVSRRLGGFIRKTDLAARMGGDEFALLLVDIESAVVLSLVMERLRSALQGAAALSGERAAIEISMGGALWPQSGVDPDVLFRLADQAMYADKARRKARKAGALADETALQTA